LHTTAPVDHDDHMPAHPPALEVDADEPEVWPITGLDARTVDVSVRDTEFDIGAVFKFGLSPGRPLLTLSYRVYGSLSDGTAGIQSPLRDLPVARWEKAARGAAERRLVDLGPYGQSVDPEDLAEIQVNEKFPELADATGGNALRRRKSLLHLAQMAAEYAEIVESGARNPAQVLGERHKVSAGTVRSWLHRARREGLALGSTHPNAVN
jgi:hypothetical protein